MNDAFLHEGYEAIDNIPEYFNGFFLGEGGVGCDKVLKIILTEFLYNVVVVGAFHDLIDCHDVG